MMHALRNHWPEYLMEAAGLGIFMMSAGFFAFLLNSPFSPVTGMIPSEVVRRVLTGLAMGLTAISITYSGWGKRSGAHLNPAITLSFFRQGRVKGWDAFFYIAAQFAGGLTGVFLMVLLLDDMFRLPPVSYAATEPGPYGPWTAFAAEAAISFVLMSVILAVNQHKSLARYTGLFAGALVCFYISVESPISGMSMNPARSFASAFPGGMTDYLWIYFTAPLLGMLLAVEARRLFGAPYSGCAKLHHSPRFRCIFCGQGMVVVLALFLGANSEAAVKPVAFGPVAITVSDLDRSVKFYSEVLQFHKEEEHASRTDSFDRLTGLFGTNVRVASLRLGEERIQLVQFVTPEGRQIPAISHSNDGWFQHIAIVVSDMERAYALLQENRVKHISTDPQTLPAWNPNAGGIKAFYFRDPDDHPLELIWFPQGKGDSRWQDRSKLFLGIDHSAISVGDTDRGLAFYRDTLGLRKAGESLNYGIEQERLNHVFGSRVRITGLRSPEGPGVEFLEYLTPRDGRAMPADTKPNDLWEWNTTLIVEDLEEAIRTLRERHVRFVSSDPQVLDPLNANARGVLVRDPDGHAILIRSK